MNLKTKVIRATIAQTMENDEKIYYLIKVAFDGRGLFGVQEVKGLKTLSGIIREAFLKRFLGSEISIMRSSRLDKGVSARELYLQLIIKTNFTIYTKIELEEWFSCFSVSDCALKILSYEETKRLHLLSIINHKTYRYFFSSVPTNDPFVVFVKEKIDHELLAWAVQEFTGEHHFRSFSIRGNENESDLRQIIDAKILYGDFEMQPIIDIRLKNVWCFEVTGVGFMRGQVRMMMGALLKLCSGQISKVDFKNALQGTTDKTQKIGFKVPGSGLVLWSTTLNESFKNLN